MEQKLLKFLIKQAAVAGFKIIKNNTKQNRINREINEKINYYEDRSLITTILIYVLGFIASIGLMNLGIGGLIVVILFFAGHFNNLHKDKDYVSVTREFTLSIISLSLLTFVYFNINVAIILISALIILFIGLIIYCLFFTSLKTKLISILSILCLIFVFSYFSDYSISFNKKDNSNKNDVIADNEDTNSNNTENSNNSMGDTPADEDYYDDDNNEDTYESNEDNYSYDDEADNYSYSDIDIDEDSLYNEEMALMVKDLLIKDFETKKTSSKLINPTLNGDLEELLNTIEIEGNKYIVTSRIFLYYDNYIDDDDFCSLERATVDLYFIYDLETCEVIEFTTDFSPTYLYHFDN